MDVDQEQRHRAALGDFPGLVQIGLRALGAGAPAGDTAQPGAGEEAVGDVVLRAGAGGGRSRRAGGTRGKGRVTIPPERLIERGAAQGEVVEGDVEEGDVVLLGPLERLRRALGDGAAGLNLGQEMTKETKTSLCSDAARPNTSIEGVMHSGANKLAQRSGRQGARVGNRKTLRL